MKWERGRQESGYEKLTLFSSKLLGCDAYVLKIPAGVGVPKHRDPVPGRSHHRINITIRGKLHMKADQAIFRVGRWLSYFRPDIVTHWVEPVKNDTFLLSFGWICRKV